MATVEQEARPDEIGYIYYVHPPIEKGNEVELHYYNPYDLDYSYNLDQNIILLQHAGSNENNDDPED